MRAYLYEQVLGKIFVSDANSYGAPDVLQVVGWTKNALRDDARIRWMYVRDVKFNATEDYYGGRGTIDLDDIEVVAEPRLRSTPFRLRLQIDQETKEPSLSGSLSRDQMSAHFHNVSGDELGHVYRWVQY